MVRPVESEPSDALRKINPRVKRTEASPEQLGYQHIEEQRRREQEDHQPAREDGHPLDADEVEIHRDEEKSKAEQPSERAGPPPVGRPKHIDVAG